MIYSQQRLTPKIRDLFGGSFPKKASSLKRYIAHQYLLWTGSGREALRFLLSYCRAEKAVQKVGVPAFTCRVVLEAVRRSGCTPVLYDSGVVADVAEIKKILPRVDALLVAHNFGFLPDMGEIASLCRQQRKILIEDCAQALGARWNNQLAGSFGDYAIYSFGISKNVGFCGGLIAGKEQLPVLKFQPRNLPFKYVAKAVLQTIIAPLFFSSHFYSVSRKLLTGELCRHQEPLPFSVSPYARRVVLSQLSRYDSILALRRRNALFCQKELQKELNGSFTCVPPRVHDAGLYLVLLSKERDALRRRLLARGVEFGVMGTFRCFDRSMKKALAAEQEHLTLVLYRSHSEMREIISIIRTLSRK